MSKEDRGTALADRKRRSGRQLLAVAVPLFLLASLATWSIARWQAGVAIPASADGGAHFVGSRACADCHARQYRAWSGSHHQLAMQPATPDTVLGDFNGASVEEGDGALFSRTGDTFSVRTTGPDGEQHDYPVRYTFGVYPLQQYLLGLPGGRLQAFGNAWDSRPRKEGGQRWFALYPQSDGQPSSPLHWTAIDQNWNARCAYCHSTGVRKHYDPATREYATSYAEISVGCEACHGPGSAHVAWARRTDARSAAADNGLTVRFGDQPQGRWHYDSSAQKVVGHGPNNDHLEVETCARCHSLGTPLHEAAARGQPIGDTTLVALLDPVLYYPDGQIRGEVFEYGSFIQSRMYHAGVTCSNCHDPHTAKLRAEGNAVCTRCHLASRYDTPDHHHHDEGSAGARCIACHMPGRTYMQVDVRHDHSIRVPRPDLSTRLGTPNACNRCHRDKSPAWAAGAIEKWPDDGYKGFQHFGGALWAGRNGAPGARQGLLRLVMDAEQPAIARATALVLLGDQGGGGEEHVFRRAARDVSPLVRRAAARHPSAALELLNDPVRSVRITAAQTLAPSHGSLPSRETARSLKNAIDEYLQVQALSADRPEAHLGLARFHSAQGKPASAREELEAALRLDPAFVPAAVNLAEFYRVQGQDESAGTVLRRALKRAPDAPALHYALGLQQVRQGESARALGELADAHRLAPDEPQYAYAYALALSGNGDVQGAMGVLTTSLQQHPYHRPTIAALAALARQTGDVEQAKQYARRLRQWQHPAQLEESRN